jgi:hypothetical protein
VLERDPLVAEVLADLVHALEAADNQALQVQLVGDAEEQVAVERVMVGHERPGQGAAVERLQDRGLHLEEAALVEPAADRADDLGAQDEELPRLLVRQEIDLSVSVSGLDVLEPVELVGRRTQRLREQSPPCRPNTQLSST